MKKQEQVKIVDDHHLCDTCNNEFATCFPKNIVWGIDRNPSAVGSDADKVLECDGYSKQTERGE